MDDVRLSFIAAAAVARDVISKPEVAASWEQPSALRKLSVRGVAGHLARAVFTVRTYLDAPPPEGAPALTAAAYLATVLADDDLDSEFNTAVRRRGEEEAAAGRDPLLARLDEALALLIDQLPIELASRTMRVIGDRPILLDEYLRTRLVEMTLHIDDLCVSVGIATPDIPGSDTAIRTLVDVARLRHGDVAVLRALARRERDPESRLRVF
ncbi:MAG TPA: maleylpyruvate isomerase N-terminal domain-containing protein [Candidatus Dormibacteraeota bacterium]|nr:maleylpyruvate isomerase N-terminal domain-containing protein [Candidatus Dormibacteraeota bacterium]